MQNYWNSLSQDDIRHLYDSLHARINACVAPEGVTLCIDVTVWSEFVIIYSYNDPPWYLYLFVVEWLACLNDPESYAGGGIAARRVTHAGQVKGDKPDEKVLWSKE